MYQKIKLFNHLLANIKKNILGSYELSFLKTEQQVIRADSGAFQLLTGTKGQHARACFIVLGTVEGARAAVAK